MGGAEGDISGTQLQPLWALGTRAGTQGTPGTSGSLASHLCLGVLNSSACFVDTWPRLSGHLLPFLLGWQSFPLPPVRGSRGRHPLRAAGPAWPRFPSAGQAPLGDPCWLGGKPPSRRPRGLPSPALHLRFFSCRTARGTEPLLDIGVLRQTVSRGEQERGAPPRPRELPLPKGLLRPPESDSWPCRYLLGDRGQAPYFLCASVSPFMRR